MMIHFWENTFWAITSLSFVFIGSKSVHPEVFRHADCSGIHFKALWWSISEKTHFGLKHQFPLYLEGQTHCTLQFSGMLITVVHISKLYDDLFLRKHILRYNFTLLCIWRVILIAPCSFQACWLQWCKFQSCMMIYFWENTFWAITSLSFVFGGSKLSAHPEVFRHADGSGVCIKAVWWSISEKTHFGL